MSSSTYGDKLAAFIRELPQEAKEKLRLSDLLYLVPEDGTPPAGRDLDRLLDGHHGSGVREAPKRLAEREETSDDA